MVTLSKGSHYKLHRRSYVIFEVLPFVTYQTTVEVQVSEGGTDYKLEIICEQLIHLL